jgi:hypothetical protein
MSLDDKGKIEVSGKTPDGYWNFVIMEDRRWDDIEKAELKLIEKITGIKNMLASAEGKKKYGGKSRIILDTLYLPPTTVMLLLETEGVFLVDKSRPGLNLVPAKGPPVSYRLDPKIMEAILLMGLDPAEIARKIWHADRTGTGYAIDAGSPPPAKVKKRLTELGIKVDGSKVLLFSPPKKSKREHGYG